MTEQQRREPEVLMVTIMARTKEVMVTYAIEDVRHSTPYQKIYTLGKLFSEKRALQPWRLIRNTADQWELATYRTDQRYKEIERISVDVRIDDDDVDINELSSLP